MFFEDLTALYFFGQDLNDILIKIYMHKYNTCNCLKRTKIMIETFKINKY